MSNITLTEEAIIKYASWHLERYKHEPVSFPIIYDIGVETWYLTQDYLGMSERLAEQSRLFRQFLGGVSSFEKLYLFPPGSISNKELHHWMQSVHKNWLLRFYGNILPDNFIKNFAYYIKKNNFVEYNPFSLNEYDLTIIKHPDSVDDQNKSKHATAFSFCGQVGPSSHIILQLRHKYESLSEELKKEYAKYDKFSTLTYNCDFDQEKFTNLFRGCKARYGKLPYLRTVRNYADRLCLDLTDKALSYDNLPEVTAEIRAIYGFNSEINLKFGNESFDAVSKKLDNAKVLADNLTGPTIERSKAKSIPMPGKIMEEFLKEGDQQFIQALKDAELVKLAKELSDLTDKELARQIAALDKLGTEPKKYFVDNKHLGFTKPTPMSDYLNNQTTYSPGLYHGTTTAPLQQGQFNAAQTTGSTVFSPGVTIGGYTMPPAGEPEKLNTKPSWTQWFKNLAIFPSPEDFQDPLFLRGLIYGAASLQLVKKMPEIYEKLLVLLDLVSGGVQWAVSPLMKKLETATSPEEALDTWMAEVEGSPEKGREQVRA